MRLTLRTLLAYLDDTLPPGESRAIGQKVAESPPAQELVDRIKKVTRRRGLSTPTTAADGVAADPNAVAAYLSDALQGEQIAAFEQAALDSDALLAEVAACHQVLTVVLSEPVRVPPAARRRMYGLVKGREAVADRRPDPAAVPPVGGVFSEETFTADPDDADAQLLLGLQAYSRSAARRRLLTAAGVGALALGLLVAVWLALPGRDALAPAGGREFALAPVPPGDKPTPTPTPPTNPSPTPPTDKGTTATPPIDKPAPPEKPPEKPVPPDKPPEKPPVDAPAPPPPPKPDRMRAGKLTLPPGVPAPLVVSRPADGDGWTRVGPADPAVFTSDRLLATPGVKASVRLSNGGVVDLWGNLPELVPAPLLWAAVTLHQPADGIDTDLTVHAGRVYLKTDEPMGAKVRLRLADEVWDLTLPDEKAEVAVEVTRSLARGGADEPPQVQAALAAVGGPVGLKARYKDLKVDKGQVVTWDSKGRGVDGPRPLGPEGTTYFARLQTYPDAAQSRSALTAVSSFAQQVTDPARVRVPFALALADGRPPTPDSVAAARVAILTLAALGDLGALVDAAEDADRPFVREAAVFGLRSALPADPAAVPAFRRLLSDKARLTDDQADTAVALLRGLPEPGKPTPAMLDRLADLLGSNRLLLRELALVLLLGECDPESRGNRALASFDAGGPPDQREAAVRAWKRRIEELKKKPTEPKK